MQQVSFCTSCLIAQEVKATYKLTQTDTRTSGISKLQFSEKEKENLS